MSASPTKLETLAIHGGNPVREKLLPYGRQSLDDSDISAVVEVLKSDWLTTGPKIAEFEERFAARVGARHAVSLSSGTAALHGAAFASGLRPGDEAITTPMTFCATANCVLYQGATPIFADVSPDTLNLDPQKVSRRFSSHTKAVIAVDYAGHPAELDELGELAKQHKALLIEDASHALGAEYHGKRVGGIADMTVFSFHPVKHLTTGEGGMVTTNDPRLAETLRRFRNHGISSEARARQEAGQWFYEMVLLGFNYRLTDIACALGISQLEKLSANLARRREIAQKYSTAFRDLPEVVTPAVREDVNPAWHLYPIRLNLETLTAGRAEVFRALRAENMGVNVHYVPVHQHPYYRERFPSPESFAVAEDAYERLISLPMFHSMTAQDVEDVIHAVAKVVDHYRKT
ncbi:MAG TPA: UDP-4-amino-4,6-dideoxy-N-acetyl-beta-L-altrosamine transaminase [Terriglobales bacterium]|jgi:perosamine synthetase|nr:UDP-4-amino-4,6-dideoxy-N-acetyl-beta-L-altrosamine transaminase [Terriglobales bacterium]